MNLFGKRKRRKKASRKAGRIPHVGKIPRARTKSGRWRKKRSDAGKKRKRKSLWDIRI